MFDLTPFKDFWLILLVKDEIEFIKIHKQYGKPEKWWWCSGELDRLNVESIAVLNRRDSDDFIFIFSENYKFAKEVLFEFPERIQIEEGL